MLCCCKATLWLESIKSLLIIKICVGLKNDKMNVCMNVHALSLNIFRFTVRARNMHVMKRHRALCNLSRYFFVISLFLYPSIHPSI